MLFYPVNNQDDGRLFSKEIVYGGVFGDEAKAYEKDAIINAVLINNLFGKKKELYMIVDAASRRLARKLAKETVPYDIVIRHVNPITKNLP